MTLSANLMLALPVLVNWVFGNYKDLISISGSGCWIFKQYRYCLLLRVLREHLISWISFFCSWTLNIYTRTNDTSSMGGRATVDAPNRLITSWGVFKEDALLLVCIVSVIPWIPGTEVKVFVPPLIIAGSCFSPFDIKVLLLPTFIFLLNTTITQSRSDILERQKNQWAHTRQRVRAVVKSLFC